MAVTTLGNQVSEWLKSPAPVPLVELKEWAQLNGAGAIGTYLGDAFLMLRAPLTGGRIRSTLFKTVNQIAAAAEAEPPLSDARVFFVRPTGRSTFPDFVSVGRIVNNDVVLDDASVTKFHAFFRVEGKKLMLSDAGSSNGTTANGKRVPVKGKGAIEPVSGMTIRFGTVETIFLDAAGLAGTIAKL